MTDTPRRIREVNADAWDSRLNGSSIPKLLSTASWVHALS